MDAAVGAIERAPDREAERVAEIDAAGDYEPVVTEPQAEAEIEPSWQQGEAGGDYEAWASGPEAAVQVEDAEAEYEL